MKIRLLCVSVGALMAASAVWAQAPAGEPAPANAAVDTSSRAAAIGPEIIVTGVIRQTEIDVLQGTSILTGEALTRDLRPTIGETLARLPGVSATSFGPSASRPILRGFQGERIRVR